MEWVHPNGTVFVIDLLRPDDNIKEVRMFTAEYFCNQIPIHPIRNFDRTLKSIVSNQEDEPLQWIQDIERQSCSLTVRVSGSNQLVAIILNELEERTPQQESSPEDKNSSPSTLVRAMIEALSQDVDLFDLHKTDKIINFHVVAVMPLYSRLGLATKLFQLSMDLANRKGIAAAKIEAFSSFAANAAAKLGFVTVKSIEYATFEYQGIKPLENVPELNQLHPSVRLMSR